MSRPQPVLISAPHEAVGALASILNIEPETVLIARIKGSPINQYTRTSFTDSEHFLAPENRVFFALEYDRSGEPTIRTKTIEDFSLHTVLRRFDTVILQIPAYGNAPKIWGSLQEFEILNGRIKAATFIRVKKISYKGDSQEGKPEVVGMFYEKNFIHDSRGKFLEYSCDLRPEWHFKFTFEKRLNGEWTEIQDPRVRQAATGAA